MNQIHTGENVNLDTARLLIEIAGEMNLPTIAMQEAIDLEDSKRGISIEKLIAIAKRSTAEIVALRLKTSEFGLLTQYLPVVVPSHDGSAYVLVRVEPAPQGPESLRLVFAVPNEETDRLEEVEQELQEVETWWRGHVFAVREALNSEAVRKFGLGWFFSQIWKRKPLFWGLMLTIAFVHIIGLAIPLFFQAVVDKVLVHETIGTLNALLVGVLVIIFFESFLKFFRDYMISHIAAKVDILTATLTFSHLLKLPLTYFGRNTTGVIANNMQQADEVREFVTARFLGSVVQFSALAIFIPVLLYYSVPLTMIVVAGGIAISLLVSLLIAPYFKKLLQLYEIEGQRKTLLVETLHGIATVKSLALEQTRMKDWTEQSVMAVNGNFKLRGLSAFGAASIGAVDHFAGVFVLYFGVKAVLAGTMTLGTLIAFRMLAEQVTEPLRDIAEIIHDWQRARLAAKMIGVMMNEPAERSHANALSNFIFDGSIEFNDVNFRFPGASKETLRNLSFSINSGETVGIVGPSGSGKSTIARLIQGLYDCNSGQIKLNNVNIRNFDKRALRQHVGVVMQDNFLFRGSVASNIALTKPTATRDEIVEALKLAGADSFVNELPDGIESLIEENGANLSGGQKQRLAIARTLIRQPQVMVFDEATSALDAQSEKEIQKSIDKLAKGRTTILIAHRLSTLKSTDRILVLKNGELVDFRSLSELLAEDSGCDIFKHMWMLQMGNEEYETPEQ